ncbi:MAG: NAD(P)H-dependent glycerol-3-phosphate dehydrogenase [Cytophagales bacterium]|nr:MAG: NAD(P)H-dependent glycerol-3-phosphate dehydrogenase [Cytophagales bacterium]
MVKVAILGGGSWATALVKILSESEVKIQWWMKNRESVKHIENLGNNPKYLTSVKINPKKVKPSSDIKAVIEGAEIVILAVPAAFIKEILITLPRNIFDKKIIVSSIKGMIPGENILVSEFIEKTFLVPPDRVCVICGPCHAEEIALEKKSYLTIAGKSEKVGRKIADLFDCRFVKTSYVDDLYGTEYCAVMKNIIAIGCGIVHGLSYGDNFQAVLVSNAMQEIKRFLDAIYPMERDLNSSAYLGDLLVTTYSQFSRNRTLGNMVGRGYSVKSAQMEMNMVAEGYWAVKSIWEINKKYQVEMPITNAVYHVIYEKISPAVEIRILEDILS